MCFRNPNLDQQHPLQAVLPNCPLAKNRNRTSRAWAWRGPHPLHIIVFSVRWPAKQATTKSVNWAVRYNMVKIYVLWKFVPHVLLKKKVFSSIGVFLFHHFVHVLGSILKTKSMIFGAKSVSSLVSLQLQCKLSTLPFGSLYLTFFAMSSRLRGKGTLEWLNTKLHFSNC